MSGQRNKKPSDVIKSRQEYLDNLKFEVQLNDANEQAVKQYKETGQVPPISQMKETRSTSQILADVEKLKINLIKDLEPVADPQFAQQIVQRLIQSPLNIDNGLLIFTAQRIEEIVKNLKKLYKYGIKGDANDADAFVSFINKMYTDNNKMTQSIKSYMNRMGESIDSMGNKDYRKIITQHFSDYISVFNTIGIQLEKLQLNIPDPIEHETPQIVQFRTIREIKRIDKDIRQKYQILLEIIPEYIELGSQNNYYSVGGTTQSQFLQVLESSIIALQGTPDYDMYINEYERYLYYLNHNIPNFSFTQSILLDLTKITKQINKNLQLGIWSIPTTLIETIRNLLSSYNGLLDIDMVEANEIRDIYNDLVDLGGGYPPGGFHAPPGGFYSGPPTSGPPSGFPGELVPLQIEGEEKKGEELAESKGDDIVRSHIKQNNLYLTSQIGKTSPEVKQQIIDLTRLCKQGLTTPTTPTETLIKLRNDQRRMLRTFGILGEGIKDRMTGKGLSRADYTQGIDPSPRYIKFGRYMINNKKLNDNVLSLRRSKGSTIATIPSTKMTSELGGVIKKIVGGGIPSFDELNALTDAEKRYLFKVSQEADIYDKIKIPTPSKDEEEKDVHTFNVMKGEILAGNNSKELIVKFKALLNKLSRTDVLPKTQVRGILEELLELGY